LEREAIMRFTSRDIYIWNGNKEGFNSRMQLSSLGCCCMEAALHPSAANAVRSK